jgi:hypothetical protein
MKRDKFVPLSIWGLTLFYLYQALEIFYRTLGTREPAFAFWGLIPLLIGILLALKYKLGRWIVLIKMYSVFLTFIASMIIFSYQQVSIFNLQLFIGVYIIYILNTKEALYLFKTDELNRKKEFIILIIIALVQTAVSSYLMLMLISGKQ